MREDVIEFQKSISTEVEKHQTQLDETFRVFASRFDAEHEFDAGFRETVVEHMRLARDEGAKVTANAIAEAEELEKASMPEMNLADIKEAVNEISSKTSQATILKSLISQASRFTPRGAFFIVKNGEFVGWKTFGKEADESDQSIRSIHFPVDSDSVLATAVSTNAVSEGSLGTYPDDSKFLEPLQFGTPDRMYAIPLIARGHGVAVLYADYGHEGISVNLDALEMLVRVAGLTVEMHATAKAARVSESEMVAEPTYSEYSETPAIAHSFEPADTEEKKWGQENASDEPTPQTFVDHTEWSTEVTVNAASDIETVSDFDEDSVETFDPAPEAETSNVETEFIADQETGSTFDGNAFTTSFEKEHEPAIEATDTGSFDVEVVEPEPSFGSPDLEESRPIGEVQDAHESPFASFGSSQTVAPIDSFDVGDTIQSSEHIEAELTAEVSSDDEYISSVHSTDDEETESSETDAVSEPSMVFDSSFDEGPSDSFSAPPFDQPIEHVEQQTSFVSASSVQVAEKVGAATTGSRLSDRNVDLPIEVPEDERRLHNDARRFARLLVSEIKLYNEKTVQEGREASNLYERLREAIDRSREMYDKRVQPPVAEKFDYFHYELVSSLANGESTKLGSSYPGSSVS